jgi:hypothetical protein
MVGGEIAVAVDLDIRSRSATIADRAHISAG